MESNSTHVAAEDTNITYMDAIICKAAAQGDINVLKQMSQEHIRSQLTPKKNTVLHIAAQFGRHDCLEWTLEFDWCSSLLRQPNGKGDTPLHVAAREGHFEMVKALVCAAKGLGEEMESGVGADKAMLRMTNLEKETALHQAVRYHHARVVKFLIEKDPEFSYGANVRGQTPLYLAAERAYGDLVDIIIASCSSPAYSGIMGRTALHAAIISDDQEATKKILEWKPALTEEVDENGWSPLHCAAYLGNTKIVRELLEKSNKRVVYLGTKDENKTALHIATSRGHIEVVKQLMLDSPDCCELVDGDGNNILHLVMTGMIKIYDTDFFEDYLLSSREVVNERDGKGNTPLHLLAHSQFDLRFFPSHSKVDKMAFNHEGLTAMDIILSGKDLDGDKGSIMRSLIMGRLRNAKASVGPLGWREAIKEEGNRQITVEDKQTLDTKQNDEIHLIVATLIATVTFAAGFTLPGGYNGNEGSDQGMAVLTKRAAFKAFVVTDSIALVLSMSAVCGYFFALHNRTDFPYKHLIWCSLLTAMVAMVVAFMTGLYAVLPHSSGLAVATCVLCSCFFIIFYRAFRRTNKYF